MRLVQVLSSDAIINKRPRTIIALTDKVPLDFVEVGQILNGSGSTVNMIVCCVQEHEEISVAYQTEQQFRNLNIVCGYDENTMKKIVRFIDQQ